LTNVPAFIARKCSVGKEPVEISGSEEDLEAGALATLNPVAADDWIELNLKAGIDRFKAAQWLEFDASEEIIMDEEPDGWWSENFEPDRDDLERQMGAVPRFVFLTQDSTTWQVVQLVVGEKPVKFLRSLTDAYVATERYDSKRVLAQFSYHSDGPGPISWSGSFAILDAGSYLLYTTDGDSLDDDSAYAKPSSLVSELSSLLDDCSAKYLYVLNSSQIGWLDLEKKAEYIRLLSDLDEFSQVSMNLTDEENAQLEVHLAQNDRQIGELLAWFSDPAGAYANKLIAGLREAIDDNSGSLLSDSQDIIEYFNQQEV
jgi:hypothetical protein